MRRLSAFIVVSVLGIGGPGEAQVFIKPTEAPAHVGQRRTVCGEVVSATFAAWRQGQPTFLYLDRPSPTEIFTVVIRGRDRFRFRGEPERLYMGKLICVRGEISSGERGVPQIAVVEPSQVWLQSSGREEQEAETPQRPQTRQRR